LLKFADTAMYQARNAARNTYMVYAAAMDAARDRAPNLIARCTAASSATSSVSFTSPTCRSNTGDVTGVEALLRWHSEIGEIAPSGSFRWPRKPA
jgi:predicted signal transduction protein with EAL and GGDEF domain